MLCFRGMVLGVTWDEEVPCPSWTRALLSPSTCVLETGSGRWSVARLPKRALTVEEIAPLLASYLYFN